MGPVLKDPFVLDRFTLGERLDLGKHVDPHTKLQSADSSLKGCEGLCHLKKQ